MGDVTCSQCDACLFEFEVQLLHFANGHVRVPAPCTVASRDGSGHSLVQKEKRKINGNGTNNVFKHSLPSQARNPKIWSTKPINSACTCVGTESLNSLPSILHALSSSWTSASASSAASNAPTEFLENG